MELQAVLAGLPALKEPCAVKVVTDSQYVLRGMTGCLIRWVDTDWRGSRVLLSTFLFSVFGTVLAQGQGDESRSDVSFRYTRVIADSAGVSHFEDTEMAMSPMNMGPGMPTPYAAAPVAAEGLRFTCFAAGTVVDWHPSPRRQFYFILSGEIELEVADGEVRRFGPGSVLLSEATEGEGVRARWMGSDRACVVTAPLAER